MRLIARQKSILINERSVIDTLLKYDFSGLPVKPVWTDGCGLSRYNLFSPSDFISILNKMRNEFGIEREKRIFPTGDSGTLKGYYIRDNGHIYAKTGSLTGVLSLSGYLYSKKNKLLIFSVLINNFNGNYTNARKKVERFIQETRNSN